MPINIIDNNSINGKNTISSSSKDQAIMIMEPFHVNVSHESRATTASINVNGTGATFENLQNITDNGNGNITIPQGPNSNFNKRANTVENILQIGEYFEITVPAQPAFTTLFFKLAPSGTPAHTNTVHYRLRVINSGYTLFDPNGSNVASGGQEAGTYRFTVTPNGFKVDRNGIEIHTS